MSLFHWKYVYKYRQLQVCSMGHSLPTPALQYAFQFHDTSVVTLQLAFHILKSLPSISLSLSDNADSRVLFIAVGLFILQSLLKPCVFSLSSWTRSLRICTIRPTDLRTTVCSGGKKTFLPCTVQPSKHSPPCLILCQSTLCSELLWRTAYEYFWGLTIGVETVDIYQIEQTN